MIDALFADDPIEVEAPSGRVYRCRRVAIDDIPPEHRVVALAALVEVQTAGSLADAQAVEQARATLAKVQAGDLEKAQAQDAIALLQTRKQEQDLSYVRRLESDTALFDSVVQRNRAWMCAAVTHIRDGDGGWFRVELVTDRAKQDRHSDPPRLWVGAVEGPALDGDARAVMAATRYGGAIPGAGFPRDGSSAPPASDGDDVRVPPVDPAVHPPE